jgi:hypothetical protein
MKPILLLLSLTLLTPTTHAQKITDPNAHLGLHPGLIDYICTNSKNLAKPDYFNIKYITSFEETLYVAAGKKKLLYSLHKAEAKLPEGSKPEIGELWNAKLNQIYCGSGDAIGFEGYIEFQLLISGQMEALHHMYADPETNNYKLNINRLIKDDPYKNDEDVQWITLADLIKDYIAHPVGQMNHAQGLRDRFENYYKLITQSWGGKHANELNPAEFEAAKAKAIGK